MIPTAAALPAVGDRPASLLHLPTLGTAITTSDSGDEVLVQVCRSLRQDHIDATNRVPDAAGDSLAGTLGWNICEAALPSPQSCPRPELGFNRIMLLVDTCQEVRVCLQGCLVTLVREFGNPAAVMFGR
jgi:hypothetical protein